MEKLKIELTNNSYCIYFHDNFEKLFEKLQEHNLINAKVYIITDTNVDKFYGEEIHCLLKSKNIETYKYVFNAGEQNKNISTIINMYEFFVNNKVDRTSVILALGGGVTGDMAGFAASTFMRGIPFIQVPTTLLSQVDSSVGGKTGIDFMEHKNIVGAFYQPKFVYINTSTLKTLPTVQFNSGMAEVIKHGLILDKNYYQYILENHKAIKDLDTKVITNIIIKSCKIKCTIVEEDEKESGIREVLNFGHTIGHAVESLSGFKLLHGESVSIGIIGASYISYLQNTLSKEDLEKIEHILNLFDLPLNVSNMKCEEIFSQLYFDKKVKNNKLKFVLPNSIGQNLRTTGLDEKMVEKGINYCIN